MPTINSIGSNIPIEISKGGTNASSFATSNGILKYDGTRLVTDAYNTVGASNNWVKSSQPNFFTWKTNDPGGVTGDGTIYGPIPFNAILFDNTSSYNSATGIFTAPKTGLYNFISGIHMDNTNNHSRVILYFSKNGSNIVWQQNVVNTSGWSRRMPIRSVELELTSGDTVAIKWSSAGDSANSSGISVNSTQFTCYFSGYLIS
jgi:hypothetical protein